MMVHFERGLPSRKTLFARESWHLCGLLPTQTVWQSQKTQYNEGSQWLALQSRVDVVDFEVMSVFGSPLRWLEITGVKGLRRVGCSHCDEHHPCFGCFVGLVCLRTSYWRGSAIEY